MDHRAKRSPCCKLLTVRHFLLCFALITIGLSVTGSAIAFEPKKKPISAANASGVPKVGGGKQFHRAFVPPADRKEAAGTERRADEHKENRQHQQTGLGRQRQPELNRQRTNVIARNGLPHRPLPGEAGFTGVPPRGETRFVSNEMVFHVASNVSPQTVDATARRLGLTSVGSQNLNLTDGTLFRFRINDGRQVADVVHALEQEKIGTAQPNYVFKVQQDTHLAQALPQGDPAQYVTRKLRLAEVHRIAIGKGVIVAMIDSQIDTAHPDLAGTIFDQFEANGNHDKPDSHGTGMTGAIVAHRKLLGVAPGVRILAIHAFSPDTGKSAEATSQHILAGIDWAIQKGARIINMSFAGPYDPMLQLAFKKAHDKGIMLIAAAGNMGPKSPPLYPAADENVIAVTAIDETDNLMPQANQGPHVALAAPGVNILEPAPNAAYQITTGTSVAAAHVSGVAALIIERKPDIDSAVLEDILYSTAKDLGPKGRDSQFGYGLVDPYRALNALEAMVAGRNVEYQASVSTPVNAKLSPRPAQSMNVLPVTMTSGSTAVSQLAPGSAQAPTPPPARPQNSAPGVSKSESDNGQVSVEKKRLVCRQNGETVGMRGPDLQDHVEVCVMEARLACLKQAVSQKIRGPGRRDFINNCMGL